MPVDDCKFSPIPGCPGQPALAPIKVSSPVKEPTGEVCQNITFTGTRAETIYSQAKPFGIDAGEKWPMGTRQVSVTKEKEFCQDVYDSNVLNASAKLQETINGYAQKNNYSIVSQRAGFDPCDRSFFGDALLWVGDLIGSDAREVSSKHCGKAPEEAAVEPAAEKGNEISILEAIGKGMEMRRETREIFQKLCDEGNWTGCFNLASMNNKL